MNKKTIGIIGFGYVGKAMWELFKDHYKILAYDPKHPVPDYPYQSDQCPIFLREQQRDELNDCDLAIICVPTPRDKQGRCDYSIVWKTLEWLKTPLILLKSTVEVGFTDMCRDYSGKRIVFSPEYCGESSYWTPYKFHTDIKETPFFIFGGAPKDTSAVIDFFLPVTGPVKTYRQTTARAAEMAKYMENSFYASKIVFCYEMAQICKNVGLDFNEVRELWLLDPRINPMHTAVFKDNEKPFSGKCLPKDLSALIEFSKSKGYTPHFLIEVLESNERIAELLREYKKSKMASE